jgi:hypothetical protein
MTQIIFWPTVILCWHHSIGDAAYAAVVAPMITAWLAAHAYQSGLPPRGQI